MAMQHIRESPSASHAMGISAWNAQPLMEEVMVSMGIFLLFTVFPVPCLHRCNCHYFQEEDAKVFNCTAVNLTSMPETVQNETTWITLSENNIQAITSSYKYIQNITHLDLRQMKLETISWKFVDDIVESMSLKYLNLADNFLRVLPNQVLQMKFVREFYISGNPYECNCHTIWMKDWLHNLTKSGSNQSVVDFEQAKCSEHSSLMPGKPLYELDAELMGCIPVPSPFKQVIPTSAAVLLIALVTALTILNWELIKYTLFMTFGVSINDDDPEDLLKMDYDCFLLNR